MQGNGGINGQAIMVAEHPLSAPLLHRSQIDVRSLQPHLQEMGSAISA
jgi:hypothetical protein